MSNINEIVVRYVAAWNERHPKRRRDLIAKTWHEDGTYRDAHRHGEGHDAIDAMIDAAQRQFPGYRIALKSGIEAHSGYARFSWAAGGAPDAPLYLAGPISSSSRTTAGSNRSSVSSMPRQQRRSHQRFSWAKPRATRLRGAGALSIEHVRR